MALRVNNVQTAAYPRCMPAQWSQGRRWCGGGCTDIDFRLDATEMRHSSPPSFPAPLSATFITTSRCLKVFHVYGNVTQLDFEISRQAAHSTCPPSPSLPVPSLLHYAACWRGGWEKFNQRNFSISCKGNERSKKSALNFSWIQRRRLGFSSRLDLDLGLGLHLVWQLCFDRQPGRTDVRTADRVSLWAKLITWSLSSYEVSSSLSSALSLFYVVDIMRNFSLVTLIERVVNTLSLGQGSWEYCSRVWTFVDTTKVVLL